MYNNWNCYWIKEEEEEELYYYCLDTIYFLQYLVTIIHLQLVNYS
jgi:hypothetical protein